MTFFTERPVLNEGGAKYDKWTLAKVQASRDDPCLDIASEDWQHIRQRR
jgi:hypothetical protein